MKFAELASCSFAIGALVACSGSSSPTIDNPDSGGTSDAAPEPDAETHDAGGGDTGSGGNTTWTFIYTTYFGAGTPGHCGNAGCHLRSQSGFQCGTTKDTCYNGLVTKGLIGTSSATQPLVDPKSSPVIWFSPSGAMPQDNLVPNAAAARDVGAWVAAGAKND